MSMTSSATPAMNKPEVGWAQVVSRAGSAPYPRPWANTMTSAAPTTTAVACVTRWIHRYPKIPITTDGTARITIHCGMVSALVTPAIASA
jgi:hypothetical protein